MMQKKEIDAEINNYINSCYNFEDDLKLNDVYVTDHELVPQKFNTTSESEDLEFFEYQQSLDAYNSESDKKVLQP